MIKRARLVAFAVVWLVAATAHAKTVNTSTEAVSSSVKKQGPKVPWRGSMLVYENSFSALSLDKAADPEFNPYYAMSLDMRPRWYLRDDLSVRGRLVLDLELTDSDSTDTAQELTISDLTFDLAYAPSFFKIPVIDVKGSASLRVYLPTSIASRARTMVMALSPAIGLMRPFKLRSEGKAFSTLTARYGFRTVKYMHKWATASAPADRLGCSPTRPECVQSGRRNRNWRFINTFGLDLQILPKLSFSGTFMLINDIKHGLDAQTLDTLAGPIAVGESQIDHTAAVWTVFDVTYQALEWMHLSLGTSTYHPARTLESNVRGPFLNRYTNIYFDIAIPIDKFIDRVRGKRSGDSARQAAGQRGKSEG